MGKKIAINILTSVTLLSYLKWITIKATKFNMFSYITTCSFCWPSSYTYGFMVSCSMYACGLYFVQYVQVIQHQPQYTVQQQPRYAVQQQPQTYTVQKISRHPSSKPPSYAEYSMMCLVLNVLFGCWLCLVCSVPASMYSAMVSDLKVPIDSQLAIAD